MIEILHVYQPSLAQLMNSFIRLRKETQTQLPTFHCPCALKSSANPSLQPGKKKIQLLFPIVLFLNMNITVVLHRVILSFRGYLPISRGLCGLYNYSERWASIQEVGARDAAIIVRWCQDRNHHKELSSPRSVGLRLTSPALWNPPQLVQHPTLPPLSSFYFPGSLMTGRILLEVVRMPPMRPWFTVPTVSAMP